MKQSVILLAALLLAASIPVLSVADEHGGWHGDIHHFHDYDMDRWRGGHWDVRFHDGRNGWWWVVGDNWYYYPAPAYPYPSPYVPYGVPAQAIPGAAYWYCPDPQGYYPYVPACYSQWQPVSNPMPQQPPQSAVPPAPAPTPMYNASQRDADDRELDKFGAEFYRINDSDRDATEHLRKLLNQVETFRQSLFDRNYNAMDLLKDTENLERRIAKKEAEISNR